CHRLRSVPAVGFSGQPERPPLESTREDDVGLGREDVAHALDLPQHALEVVRVAGPDLQQVVRLARDVVAFLGLGDRAEVVGQVDRGGARRLGDPREAEDAEADGGRVDTGGIAGDDAARLELLDPRVGRRTAHADIRAEVRVRPAAVTLEDVEDPGVSRAQAVLRRHLLGINYAEGGQSPDTLGKLAVFFTHRNERRPAYTAPTAAKG